MNDREGDGYRARRERRRPSRRPPWWPRDEPWPPTDGAWHGRRLLFRRIGCLFAAFAAVLAVGPAAILWHLSGGGGPFRSFGGLAVLAFLVFLLVVLVPLARGVRGVTLPLGDLVEAAGRVEAGDYTARVPERSSGPPEIRALPRAFNAMAARLETDERQRRRLLADIAHELRTPLAVLQGELEAIVDGVHPADEAHLAASLEETRVLGRLVDDLRTLALAEARTLALHREPTDLAILCEEIATGFASEAAGREVTIDVSVADDLPLLDVDPIRIRQVLTNLVANALRYAPASTVVRIASRPVARGFVGVEVTDTGPGIPADLLPHVFDRFAKSPESRGSGLGLAIARQLVEAHGGSITAESDGRGTTIRFELPREVERPIPTELRSAGGAGG